MGVNSFSNAIKIFANKTKRDMTRYIQKTCRGVAEEIITNSPCDTGAFIGGWTPSVGYVKASDDFVPGPSKYRGSSEGTSLANRERALSFVRAKLDTIIPLINAKTPFYFSNRVRHAYYVEYGGGNTPPYAVVRKAAARFRRILEQSATFGSGGWSNVGKGII